MWSSDFEIEPDLCFGDWLHTTVGEAAFIERQGYMPDRVAAACARLQASRPPGERYVCEIPWLDAFTAFTAPGKYVYFSRRLLERCPHEDAAAFVIAHEIAHHDLGHLDYFSGPALRRIARSGTGFGLLAIVFFRNLQKRIYSPENELAADCRAMDLCIEAGYSPAKCLYLFHIMELIYLDYGDLKGVFGLDPESDQELSAEATLMTKARIWLYQRERGYLPLQDRMAELVRYTTRVTGIAGLRPQGA
jgi:predicted Zn-dependent protease